FSVSPSTAVTSFGPRYAPLRIFVWYAANAGVAKSVPIFHVAWVVVVTVGVAASLAVATMWRRQRRSQPSDSHGSARWGAGEALRRDQGLLLGRDGQQLLR